MSSRVYIKFQLSAGKGAPLTEICNDAGAKLAGQAAAIEHKADDDG